MYDKLIANIFKTNVLFLIVNSIITWQLMFDDKLSYYF